MQCGAICGPIDRTSGPKAPGQLPPVHDLNVPYEGPEEYETPTAEMLFPPVISSFFFLSMAYRLGFVIEGVSGVSMESKLVWDIGVEWMIIHFKLLL